MAAALNLKLVSALILCILVAAPMTQAITCVQVTEAMAPCIRYLITGGKPPVPCCNGVRSLKAAARSTPGRKAACNCLKQAAGQISGIKQTAAASLPRACGVKIPYKISTSTDCSKVR